jgi:hypothetical protein
MGKKDFVSGSLVGVGFVVGGLLLDSSALVAGGVGVAIAVVFMGWFKN